ncbi:hypothetical protein M422DRAFT_50213 [Sphaerobolus stellatus SS14]|uniref:Uncharacterized protein n=1 Tax=Sphaerobolus stellatus (strain SS14) TaxID=990650 RepID=A0A0C9VJQ0_SPHS4|nr:hypothetical protein M422DRAFT_50213 [Sphaerobolus stellatus SS14]
MPPQPASQPLLNGNRRYIVTKGIEPGIYFIVYVSILSSSTGLLPEFPSLYSDTARAMTLSLPKSEFFGKKFDKPSNIYFQERICECNVAIIPQVSAINMTVEEAGKYLIYSLDQALIFIGNHSLDPRSTASPSITLTMTSLDVPTLPPPPPLALESHLQVITPL